MTVPASHTRADPRLSRTTPSRAWRALVTLLILGCNGPVRDDADADPVVAFDTTTIRIETASDTAQVRVQIAENEEQRRHGLMERRQLAPDAGMLFLYDAPQPPGSGFWMFRTRLALDIAFLDGDGRIVAIMAMTPCESPNPQLCPSYAPGVPYVHALEVNRGYFAQQSVGVGDRVILPRRNTAS